MSRELVEMARAMMPGTVAAGRGDFERAERLIAAGYRKFEIVDEPTADKWPKTGGPVQAGYVHNDSGQHGLTIRDYFAIHANADEVTYLQRCSDENLDDFQARYRYADQMLKLIEGGCDNFDSLARRMHQDSGPFAKPAEEFRVTDRRLQALRKAGRISYDKYARKWFKGSPA